MSRVTFFCGHHFFFIFVVKKNVQVFELQIQISSRPEKILNTDADLGFAGIIFVTGVDLDTSGIKSVMISATIVPRGAHARRAQNRWVFSFFLAFSRSFNLS